jgi:hypothetical protein
MYAERRPFDAAERGNWKSASFLTKTRRGMTRVPPNENPTKIVMQGRAGSRFYYASNHRSHPGVRFPTRNRGKCHRLALCSARATPGHRQLYADLAHSRRLPPDRRRAPNQRTVPKPTGGCSAARVLGLRFVLKTPAASWTLLKTSRIRVSSDFHITVAARIGRENGGNPGEFIWPLR